MSEFSIQAETLRSTAKNLRTLVIKYEQEAKAALSVGMAIIDAAQQEAAPHLKKSDELWELARQQENLAINYEVAANILTMRE